MQLKKILKNNATKTWSFLSVYSAFHSHHKKVFNNTDFEKVELTDKEKKEYLDYWKEVSPLVSFKTAEISKTLSGVFNKKIIPEEFYTLYFEPYLNNSKSVTFYENKSIYSKWFGKGIFPKNFFHKFDGNYYTYDFEIINDIETFIDEEMSQEVFPVVAKPNKDTFGGIGVNFIDSKEELKKVIDEYSDLVVEEKLQQSELMSNIAGDNLSTVRVTLYKDTKGNFHILEANIRMGKDGGLDNEGSGGIACNINSDSSLNKYATDRYANKYLQHPNSDVVFAGKKLPLYETLIKTSKDVFRQVIGARIVGLDMLLDPTDQWRCIELSLFGLTTKPSQYAGDPFLGEYTDEIKNKVIASNN